MKAECGCFSRRKLRRFQQSLLDVSRYQCPADPGIGNTFMPKDLTLIEPDVCRQTPFQLADQTITVSGRLDKEPDIGTQQRRRLTVLIGGVHHNPPYGYCVRVEAGSTLYLSLMASSWYCRKGERKNSMRRLCPVLTSTPTAMPGVRLTWRLSTRMSVRAMEALRG